MNEGTQRTVAEWVARIPSHHPEACAKHERRAAQDDITREAARAGLFTRMRFSPGNVDLPLTIQPQPIKAIAAKYGCCVIGLRLTEKGIPTYGTGTFPNSPSASNRQTHTTR